MAIQFARARYISRGTGGSAVRSAAYNGREAITAERTGELFYFRHRDAPEHHAVLLPEGAAERFRESGVLWNAAEAAERRRDAQVAREIVLALPANAEVSNEARIELARTFAEAHFVSKGLAVQLDVHAPHQGEAESERANWHAHLLITTRRIEGESFAAKKARDLDPEVRLAGGRARVADGAAWGELWREHQDRYFREHGLEARVDPTATHAQEHIGPVRMRRLGAEIVERAETIRQANQAAVRDPAQVLTTLTRNNATFTERDLDRFLAKQLGRSEPRFQRLGEPLERSRREEGRDAAEEIATVRAAVLKHADLVPLHDRKTGEAAGRFTTRQVRAEERAAMAAAGGLARSRTSAVSARSAKAAMAERTLRPDQAAAFAHATAAGNLKLIEGRAGTGKSFTLAAIRDAHERDGKRVVGLAPTNAVAQDLAADGFRASTVHAALFALKNGRTSWDRHTVVVVDEAAMLAGDDRQLASIERGGLFAELRQRYGAAEITEVTRQRVDWQRQAARDLAEGRFAEAVGAFDKAGAIAWADTQDQARRALVAIWTRDAEERPGSSRFVFAYTNRDVDALNAELRQVRRDRSELTGRDVRLETKHGAADFAIGDRLQFTDTDKKLRIYNGNVGTITGLDPSSGQITARLDATSGAKASKVPRAKPVENWPEGGREVTFSPADFQGFRHGYAGTIYKGQGKTLDRTYLYHTEHWRAAASYVALTRQRESAQVFVARETARDAGQLARQMGRGEVRAASIAWVAHEELATTRVARQAEAARAAARGKTTADPAKAYWQSVGDKPGRARDEDALRAKVRDALTARQRTNAKAEAEKPEAALSPDGRLVLAALHSKIDREFAGSAEDRAALKADAARQLIAKEAREGPVVLSAAQRRLATAPAPDREQLRRELQTLDRSALAEAARAGQVGFAWESRPMTVQDAARLVSRDYAAAADRAGELRQAAAEVEKSIEYNERAQRAGQEQGNRRWQRMGFVRQVMHKTGARRGPALAVNEAGEGHAVDQLAKLDARRAELAQQAPQAEKAEAAAFGQAKPAAVDELARRQERAGIAREVLAERRQQEAAQERQLDRSRHWSRGMGR